MSPTVPNRYHAIYRTAGRSAERRMSVSALLTGLFALLLCSKRPALKEARPGF